MISAPAPREWCWLRAARLVAYKPCSARRLPPYRNAAACCRAQSKFPIFPGRLDRREDPLERRLLAFAFLAFNLLARACAVGWHRARLY